ncbi:MAG: hypothetical protein EOM50_08495 [Erysipelotrichia bacterium]|nr:hypothetical protein [Erysipelotrichia bacterium]NCC54952.1 hypothetical protein [Erysipelotrichia bacterium]
MKKIYLLLCIIMLCGCTNVEEKPNKQEQYYKEILAIEKKMAKIDYFKMNKQENKQYLYCVEDGSVQLGQSDTAIVNYRFHQGENGVEYISTKKMVDEIQYVNQYYQNGKLYTSYSQLPNDLSVIDADASYVYFDMAIKAVDLKYYDIQKKENKEGVKYTLTLNDAKGYNQKYPEDYDDKTCHLQSDYVAVKIELSTNQDGLLSEEKITQTLHYQSGDVENEQEGVVLYQFYDYGVEDPLDFSIIE